jgi:hypothetical protein
MFTFWQTLEGSLGQTTMETQTMVKKPSIFFFHLKNQSLTRSWPLDWRGCFGPRIKWDAPLGLNFGLDHWRLRTMAVQVERPWKFMAKGLDFGLDLWKLHTMPSQRLQFLYFVGYVFSAHFFGLSTKFGHLIPRPLDLDGHSVKRPLKMIVWMHRQKPRRGVLCILELTLKSLRGVSFSKMW